MDAEYFRKIGSHRLLTMREEQELGRRIQAGGPDALAAKQKLMEFNTRLVINVATRWRNRGIEFDDLVSAGMLGLGRAAELYDPERGFKFSTYATTWINQTIQKEVNYRNVGDTIHLPPHIKRVRLHAANHPDATVEELAAACKVSVWQVHKALAAPTQPSSLDVTSGGGGNAVSGYEMVASEELGVDELAERGVFDETPTWLREGLNLLPADQREVIEAQFGLNGYAHDRTVAEVALLLDRPVKEVRKLADAALGTLRRAAESPTVVVEPAPAPEPPKVEPAPAPEPPTIKATCPHCDAPITGRASFTALDDLGEGLTMIACVACTKVVGFAILPQSIRRNSLRDKMIELQDAHPEMTRDELAEAVGCTPRMIKRFRAQLRDAAEC